MTAPLVRKLRTHILTILIPIMLVCTQSALAKETQPNEIDKGEDILMGAGAHFAWIVFDALKADLEKATGRNTVLFGENSMLGVGCKAGIKAALQGTKSKETFGFVCCPLSKEEVDKKKLIVYPLAKEPILILTRKDNPVNDLSSDQVKGIFGGDITNWKSVGGFDKPIVVVTRLHCKKRPGHWKTILPSKKDFKQDRINVKSASANVSTVNKFQNAIGHTGATWEFKPEDNVKAVSINGFRPTAKNLADGNYPFYREMSAITNRDPSPDVVKLIKEAQTGPAFRKVAKKYELLPLNPQRK